MTTPLRLTQLKLAYFKAVSQTQTVHLRPFNVIIGRNGVGKSTVLEALRWIDTAARHTTDVACDRYRGASSLINQLHIPRLPGFTLETRLETESGAFADYTCSIRASGPKASVESEELSVGAPDGSSSTLYLSTRAGQRKVLDRNVSVPVDRLALARLDELLPDPSLPIPSQDIVTFWRNAVFLRLEPSDLARSATNRRPSLEPLLDEVGATLPFLLEELDEEGREDLVDMLRSVLPDVRGVGVSRSGDGRTVDYFLQEQQQLAHGPKDLPIAPWMLSEGTRRMTAIFALLAHRPGPSLLCIEEIENGLDPVSVRKVLNYLYSASNRGVQIILTTHSPWLLDEVDPEDVLVVRREKGDTTYTRLQEDPASQFDDPRVLPGGRYIHLLET